MYIETVEGQSITELAHIALTRAEEALTNSRDDFNALLPTFTRLERLPSWGHVKAISSWGSHVSLYLKSEHRDSPLPREIAQEFHARGEKQAGENALSVQFTLGEGAAYLSVEGYLPTTCRIERVSEYIPAHQGWVNKIVCTGGADDES